MRGEKREKGVDECESKRDKSRGRGRKKRNSENISEKRRETEKRVREQE